MTTAASSRPSRQVQLSPLRRLSRDVLVIGSVVALLAAFGPFWAVRAGLVVAVAAAVASCLLAWREVAQLRRAHAAAMLAASRAAGAVLREERRRNADVVETLAERARASADGARVAGQEIVRHRAAIAELQGTLTSVRAANCSLNQDRAALAADNLGLLRHLGELEDAKSGWERDKSDWERDKSVLEQARTVLQQEVERRRGLVETLQATLAAREAELSALHDEDTTGLRGIPRRVRLTEAPHSRLSDQDVGRSEATASVPTDARSVDAFVADWADDQLAGVLDFAMTASAVALPNYEEDRKLA